jgi:hypothetical protein
LTPIIRLISEIGRSARISARIASGISANAGSICGSGTVLTTRSNASPSTA